MKKANASLATDLVHSTLYTRFMEGETPSGFMSGRADMYMWRPIALSKSGFFT